VEDDTNIDRVEVFRGSLAACLEYGLVLDARGLGYDRLQAADEWMLVVATALAEEARDELRRYAQERPDWRDPSEALVPLSGSGIGSALFAVILMLVAFCAGRDEFGIDWLAAGAIESRAGAAAEWWRPVTALTLHLDQEHLLGNLLFGIGIGTLAGRIFGPGVAWLSILLAGAAANYIDLLLSPSGQRAVGASTAVFAALGLLAGFGWRRRSARDRRYYRWAPLFGGVCLLALLGAGAADRRVDVLGHLLGFAAGLMVGWAFARSGIPRRNGVLQWMAGTAALVLVGLAWAAALNAQA
jgi:membrane associated rhomboid family serine protease